MKKYFILITVVCCFLASCNPKPELPTVTTNSVDEITDTTAVCVGEVVDNGNADITAKGFCWNTNQDPTLEDNVINVMTREEALDVFTSTISDLTAVTEYYVRAYATNSEGTAYGENIKFVTAKAIEIPEKPKYEYVDLGLSSGTLWAAHNIGATTPEGYGEHFAWGELTTKESYHWNNSLTDGKKVEDFSGNPEYDVATAQWGNEWRTPKLSDIYELVTQCDWYWGEVSGVNGFNVVSKTNGNKIFLPASGFMNDNAAQAAGTEGVLDQNLCGNYWSTTPLPVDEDANNEKACFLCFSSAGYMTDLGQRFNGFSIRPVRK